ncbi:hypothetical protein [Lignipirellula cremea]|uniref:Uncharacterized protein n=1 Tax=Lignipirellula cremea TaxID=2528010 RepID=A0A518DQW2_9BACT|nr:hypothetical protein [Lignipirellula cremea]QDU94223.1 hypothetical protein Pla8534_20110 [Lignipirellula cremea]
MTAEPSSRGLDRFFAGMAENVFQSQLGVADPPMVDYLSQLLIRFIRMDAVQRVRNPRGKQLGAIGEMLSEAEARVGDARREVHRHIGDFALFWAGIYPETLRRARGAEAYDFYGDYCQHGKHAYYIASTIEASSETDANNDVLQRLSKEFEMCAYGLREVRREWERSHEGDDPPLLLS